MTEPTVNIFLRTFESELKNSTIGLIALPWGICHHWACRRVYRRRRRRSSFSVSVAAV